MLKVSISWKVKRPFVLTIQSSGVLGVPEKLHHTAKIRRWRRHREQPIYFWQRLYICQATIGCMFKVASFTQLVPCAPFSTDGRPKVCQGMPLDREVTCMKTKHFSPGGEKKKKKETTKEELKGSMTSYSQPSQDTILATKASYSQ